MLTIRYSTSEHFCDDPNCSSCTAAGPWDEPLGHYHCQCCGAVDPKLFMIREDLWLKATGNRPEMLLCWGCTERALGRPIAPADLTDCPLNCIEYPTMMVAAGHARAKVAHHYGDHWGTALAA